MSITVGSSMGTPFDEIYEMFIFDVREFKEYYDYTEEDLQYEFKHILKKSINTIYPAKIEDLAVVYKYNEVKDIHTDNPKDYFVNELTDFQKQTLVDFMVVQWLKGFTNSSNILLPRHNTSDVSQHSPAAKLSSLIEARKSRLVEFEHNVNRQSKLANKNPFSVESGV